jgi:hypothetical protein
MFGGLQERIGLRTGGGLLLTAQERAHLSQSLSQPLQKMIKSLQAKGQAQRLRGGFNRRLRQQSAEQLPEQRGAHRMARQDLGEENREGASTPTALTAIGAKDTLASAEAALGGGGIVALEKAVPVQSFGLVAAWAALLFERKSSWFNSVASRTKRNRACDMGWLLPDAKPIVEFFPTALLTAELASERSRDGGRTALTAPSGTSGTLPALRL